MWVHERLYVARCSIRKILHKVHSMVARRYLNFVDALILKQWIPFVSEQEFHVQ